MEQGIKKVVEIPTNNKTKINFLKSFYIEVEKKEFYKNGKQKGKSCLDYQYYFFDNNFDLDNFLKKYQDIPFFKNNVFLLLQDDTRYNTNFILSNLNKI